MQAGGLKLKWSVSQHPKKNIEMKNWFLKNLPSKAETGAEAASSEAKWYVPMHFCLIWMRKKNKSPWATHDLTCYGLTKVNDFEIFSYIYTYRNI